MPVLVFAAGLLLVVRTVYSAIRTFVLPRGVNDVVTRVVFGTTRRIFDLVASQRRSYEFRDRIMAYFGPVTLILLPAWWLLLVCLGYSAMFWAVGAGSPAESFAISGSSLLTLGFARAAVHGGSALAFSEAAIGLVLVALLISYLPTIYGAFSRRELLVSLLEVRADSPPSPIVMLTRFHRLHGLDALHEQWERWEAWFSELEETHASLPVLVFYRSQQADHSWVNAAGAIMDAAAITRSAVDVPLDVQADLTIRAGYLALRRIAAYFRLPFPEHPSPTDPTSIDRARFEQALDVLIGAGVPLKADRDQAWRDFSGWRVNYDAALRALERLTMAPTAWWERPMVSAWATDEPAAGPRGTASPASSTEPDPGGG